MAAIASRVNISLAHVTMELLRILVNRMSEQFTISEPSASTRIIGYLHLGEIGPRELNKIADQLILDIRESALEKVCYLPVTLKGDCDVSRAIDAQSGFSIRGTRYYDVLAGKITTQFEVGLNA